MNSDPRLSIPASDHRVRHLADRRVMGGGEAVLKAIGPLPRKRLPSALEVEHERSLWGPHDSPVVSRIEEDLYLLGARFLRNFAAAILGRSVATFAKAESPKPPGWGDVMKLFATPAPPEQAMATWDGLLDGFIHSLLPGKTVEDAIAVWSLRTNLLAAIGERVASITTPGTWAKVWPTLPPSGQEQLAWSKAHGAQFVTKMSQSAKTKVMEALVESKMAGGNHHDLSRTLLERLGTLNRDWRRIAITETAMAVSSGQLATVADKPGEWEAVWIAGPKACPFCQKMNGRTFNVVKASKVDKNGDSEVWPGKTNVNRSAHLHRKDGTKRTKEEMWHPAQPAHPLCMCSWVIRLKAKSKAAQNAAAKMKTLMAEQYAAATS
jgi:hypothetical protein